MPEIRVSDLKTHADAVIRSVREKGMRYIVTHRGRPVAAIVPVEDVLPEPEGDTSAWDELVSLGEQISQNWTTELSSVEILSGVRR